MRDEECFLKSSNEETRLIHVLCRNSGLSVFLMLTKIDKAKQSYRSRSVIVEPFVILLCVIILDGRG